MNPYRFILLLVLCLANLPGQFNQFKKLNFDQTAEFHSAVIPVQYADEIKLFKQDGFFLNQFSTDAAMDSITLINRVSNSRIPAISNAFSIVDNEENIFIAHSTLYTEVIFNSSNDNGQTFNSSPIPGATGNKVDLTLTSDNLLILTAVTDTAIVNYFSKDYGVNWNGPFLLQNYVDSLSYAATLENNDGSLLAVVSKTEDDLSYFFTYTSNDTGKTWVNENFIFAAYAPVPSFYLIKDGTDEIFLIYNKLIKNNSFGIEQADVFYRSTADGLNWTEEIQYTTYLEDDYISGAGLFNSEILLITNSTRYGFESYNEYASIIGTTVDDEPPAIFDYQYKYSHENEEAVLLIYADDLDGIDTVSASIKGVEYLLLDDGNSSDYSSGDNIFGIILGSNLYGEKAIIDINNIYTPFDNRGIIASVQPMVDHDVLFEISDIENNAANFNALFTINEDLSSGMKFINESEGGLVYSGGFFLSGYDADGLWANGVASVSLTVDYLPGNIDSSPGDLSTNIYYVKRSEPEFGSSWQNWKYAVDAGAYFYDGDGDGLYQPVDLNGNGLWDPNEDKPDILYDETYFTVYNDGVPADDRRYNNVSPKGIEIRQTVFASSQNSLLSNTVFVRYSILNTGMVQDTLKDVIFSMLADIDIGGIAGYGDDLPATDTLLNSVYSYNYGEDPQFGINPPAVYLSLIQGPAKFTGDENDIAYNRRGPDLGIDQLIGHKNLEITAGTFYVSSDPDLGDADNEIEVRNYQFGKTKIGDKVDPCDFGYGEVINEPCENVNPLFWCSGDPVTNTGWLNLNPSDQREMFSAGTFDLVKDKPVDIIVAYTAEQGADHLNSITKTRSTVSYLHEEYQNNFSTIVGVKENPQKIVKNFSLSQNYPNPFNPTTKIEYVIASPDRIGAMQSVKTTLVVYNILGQQIKTLVNEVKSPGSYEVTFDASQLASGVYFYKLTTGDFVQTKKMMLIK